METVRLKVAGMTCSHCVQSVKQLAEEAGGKSVQVNLSDSELIVEADHLVVENIIHQINESGIYQIIKS